MDMYEAAFSLRPKQIDMFSTWGLCLRLVPFWGSRGPAAIFPAFGESSRNLQERKMQKNSYTF